MPSTDVQRFLTSGTWVKPDQCRLVKVYCNGPGGGGGSGGWRAPGVGCYGGGGGGGGGRSLAFFRGDDLPGSVAVTVGTGLAGGLGVTYASVDIVGLPGGTGVASQFGDFVIAKPGVGGNGGTVSSGGGGAGGGGNLTAGAKGGDGTLNTPPPAPTTSILATWAYCNYGGGGGHGQSTGATTGAGGGSGSNATKSLGSYFNAAPSVNGFVDGYSYGGMAAVGGTGASLFTTHGRGGHGAFPGSGGGGGSGGYGTVGVTSGAGGNGGNGVVIVVSYCGP